MKTLLFTAVAAAAIFAIAPAMAQGSAWVFDGKTVSTQTFKPTAQVPPASARDTRYQEARVTNLCGPELNGHAVWNKRHEWPADNNALDTYLARECAAGPKRTAATIDPLEKPATGPQGPRIAPVSYRGKLTEEDHGKVQAIFDKVFGPVPENATGYTIRPVRSGKAPHPKCELVAQEGKFKRWRCPTGTIQKLR